MRAVFYNCWHRVEVLTRRLIRDILQLLGSAGSSQILTHLHVWATTARHKYTFKTHESTIRESDEAGLDFRNEKSISAALKVMNDLVMGLAPSSLICCCF